VRKDERLSNKWLRELLEQKRKAEEAEYTFQPNVHKNQFNSTKGLETGRNNKSQRKFEGGDRGNQNKTYTIQKAGVIKGTDKFLERI
jgi:hypothetical protein